MSAIYATILAALLAFAVCDASLFGKLHWRSEEKEATSRLHILHKPESLSFAHDAQPVDVSDISKVVSLSFGIPTAKDLKWNGLLVGDIFNRPKAALVFTLDGIPNSSRIKVTSDAKFGINTDSGTSVADPVAIDNSESVISHVGAAYNGQMFSVSAAADEDVAMASYNENGDNYFYSDKSNGWILLNKKHLDGQLILSNSDVVKDVSKLLAGSAAKYDASKSTITVDGQTVFDMKNKVDRMLFAEMKLVEFVVAKLSSNVDVIHDGNPDIYVFTLSSVKDIITKYGAESPQGKLAMSLIGSLLNKVTSEVSQLYNGNIVALAAVLGLTQSDHIPAGEVKSVYHHLRAQLGSPDFGTFEKNLPNLHILKDLELSAKSTLCSSLKNTLAGLNKNFRLNCLHEDKAPRIARRSILQAKSGSDAAASGSGKLNLASKYSADFPIIFNIWLWLVVLLFLVVYVVSLAMWYMDPGRDSIIYRMTSQRVKTD